MLSWNEIFKACRGDHATPERLLCLDPGETTGWALFEHQQLVRWEQIETVKDEQIIWKNLIDLFIDTNPTYIVCEDYRIYEHKLARHSFSPVLTLRLIGGIDLLSFMGWYVQAVDRVYADSRDKSTNFLMRCTCPIHYQMATTAKGFVTDDKLKYWDFWQDGMRHSRDAIRHGCYFLLFYKKGEDI
jgi:hypothetical protein